MLARLVRGPPTASMASLHTRQKRSWRVNDWTWGRLDASRVLCQTVLQPDRVHRYLQTCPVRLEDESVDLLRLEYPIQVAPAFRRFRIQILSAENDLQRPAAADQARAVRALEKNIDRIPNETLRRRARHVVSENSRVMQAVQALMTEDLAAFGRPADQPDLDLRRRLDLAMAGLDDTHRLVFVMHDMEGYTHREIAMLMQKTESYSKSQLSRAHQRLRALHDVH